jgi:hypothetical protein
VNRALAYSEAMYHEDDYDSDSSWTSEEQREYEESMKVLKKVRDMLVKCKYYSY